MRREILFRGKREDNGEWVEGFYYSKVVYIKILGTKNTSVCHYIMPISVPLYENTTLKDACVEVDSETICQYTGSNDKNGNKIWENDIVEIPKYYGYFKIEWQEDTARWIMDNESEGIIVDFDNFWSYEVEVISDIFSNPELLNQ